MSFVTLNIYLKYTKDTSPDLFNDNKNKYFKKIID